MKAITRRLQKLERRYPPNPPRPAGPSGAEKISSWLAQNGIARGENESLMATFARALHLTESDVRVYLQRRAAGQHAELATDIGTYRSGLSQSLAPANPRAGRFAASWRRGAPRDESPPSISVFLSARSLDFMGSSDSH
jgi:hypothetical protein